MKENTKYLELITIVDNTKFQEGRKLNIFPNFRYLISKYHLQEMAQNNKFS